MSAARPAASATQAATPDQRRRLRQEAGRWVRRALDAADAAQHASLLLSSGAFDPAWYAARSGSELTPAAAARHYLRAGGDLSPHPLFDPEHLQKRNGKRVAKRIGKRNPLLAYLTDAKLHRASFHPLFDVAAYLAANPGAVTHRFGPLGHYLATGAAEGLAPNTWYPADPEAEPQGLADWLRARRREWEARAALASSPWTTTAPTGGVPIYAPPAIGHPLVSVVVPACPDPDLLRTACAGVLAQTVSGLDVIVVHRFGVADAVRDALGEHAEDARVRLVAADGGDGDDGDDAALLAHGAAVATGDWVAFCPPVALWRPDHLATVLSCAQRQGSEAAYDVVERTETSDAGEVHEFATVPVTPERAAVEGYVSLAALVVRRATLAELGGIDRSVHCAAGHDLELRLLARGPIPLADRVGVLDLAERRAQAAIPPREQPWLDIAELTTWHDVVLDRQLSGWDALAPEGDPGLVSIIIPTHADSTMTTRAVRCVSDAWETAAAGDPDAADVEILVLDNGCDADHAARLQSLPHGFRRVRVLHEPVNRGFALGNNLAMRHARGDVVVFLNNDTEVVPGWLEPLVRALDDPSVLGAQSLLVYPSGSIQSAGIAFPSSGGVPHMLLQGFPIEDADGIEDAELHAATAAALAVRRADVIALRGFDPIFRNGMEDVDFGLRMRALRPGRFTVRTDSVVVHHESRSPGRFGHALVNRRVLLDRYRAGMPADDVALWGARGYDVAGHEVRNLVSPDRRVGVPEPVLVRRPLAQVSEGPPRLRWALKNPAPAGLAAQRWGDTHFIASLSAALRRLGQQVVVDHRGEFARTTGQHDDVVLVLRGLAPYSAIYGQISMAWLISHPEMFSRSEAATYDRVFAASATWSASMSAAWGVRIDPLLQATDPELFHPDRGRPDTGHPVLFIGGSRKIYRPMVRDAIDGGLPLSLYGEGWDDLVPRGYLKASYVPNAQVGEAYRRAGVVLNDHWDDMRLDGFLSNRLFDAAGSGARVITDDVRGLEGLFGRSVQVARTPAELVALATAPNLDAVFGDDAERRAVAKQVHAEHSFDARARTLLDAALELRARLSDPIAVWHSGATR
ncbi:glycosyltransferase [uncultured Jatrophihabitans sp.]|uniref:glycosyltransferase n=1 Tax=uncultured Jatrophihabitans sp. TaxID=1610747 RepID=UPI0035CA8FF2